MPSPISWEFVWPYYLAALVGGYVLGSIPFGLLLTRAAGLGDIRRIGSGNIGATNVLRTGRKGLAALTVLLDGGKGAVAVAIALLVAGRDEALLAGLGAVLGHMFPVWLGFKGGKAVATTLGVLLVIEWPIGVLACLLWLLVAVVSRYSSLAAILSFACTTALAWVFSFSLPFGLILSDNQVAELATILTILVIGKHHANIRRLLNGTESKIGGSSKAG